MGDNQGPQVVIGLSLEDAEFLERNCDANVGQSLQFMQKTHDGEIGLSHETIEKLVEMMEVFKRIRKATRAGIDEA